MEDGRWRWAPSFNLSPPGLKGATRPIGLAIFLGTAQADEIIWEEETSSEKLLVGKSAGAFSWLTIDVEGPSPRPLWVRLLLGRPS